jgi:hypothetical protein
MISEKLRRQNREGQGRFREKNRDLCNARVMEVKKRWIKEGRCSSCGIELVQGENKTCVNCGNTIKGEFKYATDCKGFAKVF